MNPETLRSILVCAVTIYRCRAVPYILEDPWSLLKGSAQIGRGCPEYLPDPFYVPHETDCDKFYLCQRGHKILMKCASFLEFNSELGICDWPQNSKCLSDRAKITKTHSAGTDITIDAKKEAECLEDQQTPHKNVCNQYYRCVYGQRVLKICPDNMVFNSNLGRCDFQFNVICETIERPADENGGVIYDYLGDYDYYDDFPEQKSNEGQSSTSNDGLLANQCPEVTEYYGEPVFIPHETKCNAYYACFNGRKQELFCPDTLEFNSKFSICDWPDSDQCRKEERLTPLQSYEYIDKMYDK